MAIKINPTIIVTAQDTEWLFFYPKDEMDGTVFFDYKNRKIQKNEFTIELSSDGFEHLRKLSKRIVQILNSKTEHQFDTMLSYHYFPETDLKIQLSMKITSDCWTLISETTENLLRKEFSVYKNICLDAQQMIELAGYLYKKYREERIAKRGQKRQLQNDRRN